MHIVFSEHHLLTSDHQTLFGREVKESLDLKINAQHIQMQRHEKVLVAEQSSATLFNSSAKPSISPLRVSPNTVRPLLPFFFSEPI